MSCNKNKIKQTCGVKVYAPCVNYELEIPEYSPLHDEECINLEETTKDLYDQVGEIKEGTDLSLLGLSCLTYVPAGQKPKVKDILLKYEQEICELKSKVSALENTDICDKIITNCNIDLSGIEDDCNNPVTTLGQLLNYLITKVNI